MEQKTKTIKITYKIKLNTEYKKYFILTNRLFNESLKKYFEILIDNKELLKLPKNQCMQKLNDLTVITKSRKEKGEVPKYYFEQQLLSDFRKAVICKAIGYAKVYFYNNGKNQQISSNYIKINAPTTFYKRTYKYINNEQIAFKLFNGEKWDWYISRLSNWKILENKKKLSPNVVLQKDCVMVHIPIEKEVEIINQQEIRKENDLKVCGVVFTNTNSFAVCVALDDKGKLIKSKFICGGDRYRDSLKRNFGKMKKNNRKINSDNDYKKYFKKIIRINQYHSHYVSKKIIDFCKENKIKVISITESNDSKLEPISKYEHIKNISNPIELSKKIIEYLDYKAQMENILIIKSYINSYDKCYKCLKPVKEIKGNNLKIICEEGHESDYYFNAVMNIGRTCLRKLGRRI